MLGKLSIRLLFVGLLVLFACSLSRLPAQASGMQVWTASSYENIFQDSLPPGGATTNISWVVVRNEYESAQIMLRDDTGFTINGVTFSDLTSGGNTIAGSNLQYNYVQYVPLSANTQDTTNIVRSAPGNFPDPLSNDPATNVAANTTQPIWVTLYIPKSTVPGTYAGTATVNTTAGSYTVNLSAEVANVTIPDSNQSALSWSQWQQIGGTWHFDSWADHHPNDNIVVTYGYERWTPQWWDLVADMAKKMKAYRTNILFVNPPKLLLDGGTYLDSSGNYVFNWSKFDQYIQYFIDAGVVKGLESHALTQPLYGQTYKAYLIKTDSTGAPMATVEDYGTTEANNWYDQYIPALYAHLKAKGWLGMWIQSIGDEPTVSAQYDIYNNLLNKIKTDAPDMKVADAFNGPGYGFMSGHAKDLSILVPNEDTYQYNKNFFDSTTARKDEIWMYNANYPGGNWLHRFVDTPVWGMRSLGWLFYNWNVTGYLHWAWNVWTSAPPNPHVTTIDDNAWKGDDRTVYPDVPNNKIRTSIRYANGRDASEDYDIFNVLGQTNPELAKQIASSIAPDALLDYSTNISAMQTARNELVRAAGNTNSNIADWEFDEGSGSTAGDSWGSNAGTIVGNASWVPGRDGNALSFDGSTAGVTLGKANLPAPWTASMWVKRTASSRTTDALISSPTTALKLEQWNGTHKVGFTQMGVGDYAFDYTAPVGQWVNLTFVANTKGTSLYVNGQFKQTINHIINLPMDTIGYKRDPVNGNTDFLSGTLDHLKVYNKALSPAEIAKLGTSAGIDEWKFDETSGNASDTWGGHTGKVSGGATYAAGKINNALVLDGSSGGVDLGMSDIPVPWTASMWVRKDATQTSSALMSSFNGALKLDQYKDQHKVGLSRFGHVDGNGNLDQDHTFNYTAPVGSWENLTFVGTSSGTSLYVNGVLQGTDPFVMSLPMGTIGYRKVVDGTKVDFLQGAMDEVKVYDRALSQSEINQVVQSDVSYWNFDEGSGTMVTDSWGGTQPGTMTVNPPTWTTSGHSGDALVFNGVDNGIYLGRANIKGQWTASMWVKRSASSLATDALMSSPEAALKLEQYNGTHEVGFTKIGVGDYTFNYTAPVGQWVNLTFVCDGISTSLYVNGTFQQTINAAIDLPMETIGYKKADAFSGKDSDFLSGTLDDIKIFNRPLSTGEISQLMQQNGTAYWKFDEGAGTTSADSWGTRTVTLNGAAWTTSGHSGDALSFNGSSAKADAGAPDLTGDWTAMMWVKKGADTSSSALLSSDTGALKLDQYNNTHEVGFSKWGVVDYAFPYSAPAGQWVHLAFVGTSSGTSLYVDGVFEGSSSTVMNLPMDTIGYRNWNGNLVDYLNGTLDDVKIYNRAMSQDEIIRAMQN